MFNKKSTTASQSRNTKIAIAAICVIILALCIIFGSTNNASAMNSVNDAQNNEVVIDAVDATDATKTEPTEATEDEEEKEVVEVPVYIYVPVETTVPEETEPTTPPTTEPEEEDDDYEELPEATKPEEETQPAPEEEEDDEEEETTPVHVHNFSITWTVVKPTCTAHGYTIYICDGCTETENRDFVEPIGHEYIVYKHEGYETHWCANCGDTYQVEVEVEEPAPADETIPVETEPEETEPVEETEPAPTAHTCDPSDGHNHKEVKSGPFTYVYCDEMAQYYSESADGRTKYFEYSWCL